MAFPSDLEIEVAFNNDIDETDYAQSGWTSILPYVAGFQGDLRGRAYELDRTESGSLTVTLDNVDGRFLPSSVQSPYYPFVKSDRRFRIRGKNMVHPNVARGGSRDRAETGFIDGIPGDAQTLVHTSTIKSFEDVSVISASAEPNAGQGKENVYDENLESMWTINTQAGWIQYQYLLPIRFRKYTLTIPAGNTTRNPDDWTLQGSNNGSSWTVIDTVTANTWSEDYETQEFTVDSPGLYSYYRLDITGNVGAVAATQLAEWHLSWSLDADLPTGSADLTHYNEVTVQSGLSLNTWYETVSWYVPLEYGVRLSHSAQIFRASGTEPTGWRYKFHITYLDSDYVDVGSFAGVADPNSTVTTLPTGATLTQLGFSHTPPNTAKYGVMSLAIFCGGTTNATAIVYGITGIQSELPANLAPDISGYRDNFNWQIESEGTAPGTVSSFGNTGSTGAIVEATSPAYVSSNASPLVTAAFTPTNNSLLVALVTFANGSDGALTQGTVTDSLGGTWTRKISDFLTAQSDAEIWIRDVVTGASMTVTWTRGGAATASGMGMKVMVLTGAKTVANQTGATASLGGSNLFIKSITTTFDRSRVYGVFARNSLLDIDANDTITILGTAQGSSGDVHAAFKAVDVVQIPQTHDYGFENIEPVGTNRMALIEILANNINASDPTAGYVSVTWGVDDSNLYITIPHLIPGETYTATVNAQKVGAQPNLLFSADEGQSGVLVNTTSMAQYSVTFVADQAEQELRFILQGTPTAAEGMRVNKLRVELGSGPLTLPTTAIETGMTSWLRPKDIFEGWVESWPAVAGSLSMNITVNDRMDRVGQVDLANTLRESLLVDEPALVMPLSDSMLDTPGRFSQLGYWGDFEGGPTFVDIDHTKGDISTASYTTLTDDGPSGEASVLMTPIATTGNGGYMFLIPYSKDSTVPTVPTIPSKPKPPPFKPKPSPTKPKYTYTKKWYATWSRSYEGDDSTRFDDSPYMYQGQFSGSPGNQKSLAGFDYRNIMATLKGAEILSCHITVTNEHARWNKGLYAFIGTHNYSSKPSTWSGSTVVERRYKKWVGEGGSVTVDAGPAIGRAFRDGTQKGISLGPESDSDYYGYFRGASHSGRPVITIKYRK